MGRGSRANNFGTISRKAVIAALLATTAIATSAAVIGTNAYAQTSAQASFNIPAGPLNRALASFGSQSGTQLSYEASIANGKTSPGLTGAATREQALAQILQGSGLIYRFTDGRNVLISEPGDAATGDIAADGSLMLETITIQGQSETATSPFTGFAASRSATGTKTDTPLIETPQSVTVLGSDEIRSRDAKSLQEALSYVAGVNRAEGADKTTDTFILRGFRAMASTGSFYRDGMKYSVNEYDGQQEPYGLERIEVLKGSSSVLYGAAAPGGIINTVTKRPTDIPLRELNIEYGSYNRKQISGDFGGPLTKDGDLSYRLTFLHRKSDTFIDYIPDDRTFIAPAITWKPSDSTSLTLLGEYQHDVSKYQYGLPAQGTVLPNPNGRIPQNRFNGEPDFDTYDNTRWSLGYQFQHDFNDQLTFRSNGRYVTAENYMPFTLSSGLQADMRTTAWREYWIADRQSSGLTFDNNIQYKWGTDRIANTSLFGLDYTDRKWRMFDYRTTATPLDFFDPVYGQPIGDLTQHGTYRNRVRSWGLYGQNQAKIDDKWVFLLGARQDWANIDNKVVDQNFWANQKYSAFTWRAGAVYLADNGLAPYVSYAQGFDPVVGSDRFGNAFEPTESEQYEVGLRYQPPGTDLMFSAGIFDLTQRNVTVRDPVDISKSVQMGEVRSRGVELEARGTIGDYWSVAAAYTYTDARTIKSSPATPELEGKRSGGVPYNSFSLWAEYDFEGLGISGLKAGAGVRYMGSQRGLFIDVNVPSYTVVDAMISYTRDDWTAALHASNLFDKTYVASCTYDCFYGEPLNVKLSLSKRW